MQRYMKSDMPYLGVQTPALRQVCRVVFDDMLLPNETSWHDTVLSLWRNAAYREERYAAIGLTGHRAYAPFQRMKRLPMYEEMVVTGAWWDYVDAIAPKRLGGLLRDYPVGMSAKMRTWSRSKDMWKRRASIICQLTFKTDTDETLLFDCITPSMSSREFFLRKGIGWALRQHAYSNPDIVVRFVRKHATDLSPLSKREALRNLLKSGFIHDMP